MVNEAIPCCAFLRVSLKELIGVLSEEDGAKTVAGHRPALPELPSPDPLRVA